MCIFVAVLAGFALGLLWPAESIAKFFARFSRDARIRAAWIANDQLSQALAVSYYERWTCSATILHLQSALRMVTDDRDRHAAELQFYRAGAPGAPPIGRA